jgi:hypothetical protein
LWAISSYIEDVSTFIGIYSRQYLFAKIALAMQDNPNGALRRLKKLSISSLSYSVLPLASKLLSRHGGRKQSDQMDICSKALML